GPAVDLDPFRTELLRIRLRPDADRFRLKAADLLEQPRDVSVRAQPRDPVSRPETSNHAERVPPDGAGGSEDDDAAHRAVAPGILRDRRRKCAFDGAFCEFHVALCS